MSPLNWPTSAPAASRSPPLLVLGFAPFAVMAFWLARVWVRRPLRPVPAAA